MLKYLRLYRAFLVASLKADLEYRMNFLSRIVTDIFWYAAQIITFEALFLHTEKLGTWGLPETRVFLGMLFVVDALYMIILSENLDKISDRVRKGEMDLLLAKPVNSQFMMSCQRANTAITGNLLLGSAWLIWSLAQLPDFNWFRLLWLLILIPSGLIALYGIRFMISTTAVIFTRSENLQYMWYQLYRLGMRPDSIYSPWLKFVVITVLPVGLIASVPSRFLLEPPDFYLLPLTLFVSFSFLWMSRRFWNYALKFYSSASS
ncbi:MAG: ABC transporter permease [Bdellovibrio sp.]